MKEANITTTSYAYDTLNDLTLVCQGAALVSGLCPSGTQSRAFVYDSLARLKSATNPESGTTSYTYDYNGNLTYKTDSNLNDTTLAYDALNRITSKTYTYSSSYYTPTVDYCYDGNTQSPCNTAPSGATNYLVGRLTQVTSSASTTNYGKYSALGDILSSSQTTGGNPYPFAYTYNLANAMKTMTQPSGRTFTWTYDIANRATKLAGAPSGGGTTNYASAITYASQGPISQFTLGNGLVENRSYDPYRQQPIGVTLGTTSDSTSVLNLGFSYCGTPPPASCTNNNGNLQSQSIGTLSATQTYTYDGYNRLNVATEKSGSSTIWSETFNYDIYGNRWVSPNPPGLSLSALTVTSNVYSAVTNRLASGNFGYDSNGNETYISPFTMTYDVENRQTGFTSVSNGTATYTYDGDGRRVTKTTGGVTTTYVYDAKGDLAAEYSTQPPPPCLTCYVATDHLGSTRVVTDENAAVTARHDFLPFGEELTTSNRTSALGYGVFDNVMHKFTGQMRDLEGPGLDYFHARYFHGAQGRFASPDPNGAMKQKLLDPQQWDMYAYVRNSPLRLVDPQGRYVVSCSDGNKKCNKAADKFEKEREKDLNSKDAKVREAAEAWGKRGEDNHISVTFKTQAQVDADARTAPGYRTDAIVSATAGADHQPSVKAEFSESLGGSNLGQTIAHEGSHVEDDMNFLKSYDPATGKYSSALNFTHFDTEFQAFEAGSLVKPYPMFPRGPRGYQQLEGYIYRAYPNADELVFPTPVFPQ